MKVSGQGKLEFESDLSKMLIKQIKYLRFCKNIALALGAHIVRLKMPIKLIKCLWF